jgi:PleD family two-component response regulator
MPAWNVLARFAVLWMFGALSHLSARLAEETGLSRTDALTGLPNARAFREAADEEIDRMRASGTVLTAAWSPRVGFSVGAVTFETPPTSAADLLEQADQVMYGAKRHGRNTVRGVNADTCADPSAA